ncbi:MAG TPA: ribbon-helix-helix domain-containing protein [Patescibacteria group bacterium]|nr:ribbon-helix-helix domain-containing protein [Patescibacteria group bacterium]
MQTQTLNISLPKELVKKIDNVAATEYKNRSELIREATRIYVDRVERWNDIFAAGEAMGKKMGIKSEEDINRLIKEYRSEKRKTSRHP